MQNRRKSPKLSHRSLCGRTLTAKIRGWIAYSVGISTIQLRFDGRSTAYQT